MNPYSTKRSFNVTSTDDTRVSVRESKITLEPKQSDFIHLSFLPLNIKKIFMSSVDASTTVWILIVDDTCQPEECLAIHIQYQ
jgi:hypothetical protein